MVEPDLNPDFSFAGHNDDAVRSTVPDESRQGWVERLLTHLSHRDRLVEDYLNRMVVRRVKTTSANGNGTTKTGTAWQIVAPEITVDFYKANPNSHLTVWVSAAGDYDDAAAPSWVEFGVLVNGTDYPVCRRLGNVTNTYYQWAGSADIEPSPDLEPGTYEVTLVVRGQNAGTSFTSHSSSTLCLTVTESA